MQVHIALYKWKPGVSDADIDKALAEIAALGDRIDGIVEISCAKNESKYSEGYTHVILVRGESAEALQAYRSHPDHQKTASKIEAMEEAGVGVDFATN